MKQFKLISLDMPVPGSL